MALLQLFKGGVIVTAVGGVLFIFGGDDIDTLGFKILKVGIAWIISLGILGSIRSAIKNRKK